MFGDKRWYLFSLLGNKVYISASFLIVMALFAFSGVQDASQLMVGLLWIPILFISILLHELGHAVASKSLGYGNSQIVFWGLGGVAVNSYSGRRAPKKDIIVSLAGPAVSFVLAGLSFGAWMAVEGAMTSTGLFGKFLELMFMANMFWAVFNMLPIYPMDGGQALSSGLKLFYKNQGKALRTTGIVSIVALVVTIGISFPLFGGPGTFMLLLGAYFAYLNWGLIQSGRARQWF